MSIDRGALWEAVTEVLIEDQHWHSYTEAGRMVVDAILPAVEQAIRAAEQRGREQVHAEMRAAWVRALQKVDAALARGGSTDEEQTP